LGKGDFWKLLKGPVIVTEYGGFDSVFQGIDNFRHTYSSLFPFEAAPLFRVWDKSMVLLFGEVVYIALAGGQETAMPISK
jgi:hypothetical protein